MILCEDLSSVAEAEQLAARLVAATSQPWQIQGRSMAIHVSIGIAVTDSASTDAAALLRDADAAMYMAKKEPGSTSVFDPQSADLAPMVL